MTDQATPTQALERRPAAQLPGELLSDDEIRRMYRIAESFHLSGAWKNQVKNAEAAFAKMIIGRDLGLSAAQSMQGIYIVEGGIQMNYAMLGHFVRAREGYDFRAGWVKEEPTLDVGTRDEATGEVRPTVAPRVFVWDDEEEPLDDRPVVGSVVVFFVDGVQRGVSRYTEEDARAAGLIKPDARAAWNTSRRNMLRARSMSNGVKWYVPEVMGGLPVYVEGELVAKASLTEGTAEEHDAGQGVDLGPKVNRVIARAERLGHRGLSNRGAVEIAVGDRAPGLVNDWVDRANAELDRFQAEKRAANPDGEVQADEAPPEVEVEAPPEEVTAEPMPEEAAPDVPTGPSSPVTPDPDQVVTTDVTEVSPEVAILMNRWERLNGIDPVTLSEEDADQLHAELDMVEGKLREAGAEVGR